MKGIFALFLLVLSSCGGWVPPADFFYAPITSGEYQIVTYQRFSDTTSPVHIYLEGDGNSFDGHGMPTADPTPAGTFMRDLAAMDSGPNVVYIARPCQFIKSPTCTTCDWTDGRFSEKILDAMSNLITDIVKNRPVVLIGYSGGAMISGLIIQRNPELNVKKWVTIAGVLNHAEWTDYFDDMPLSHSLNLNTLPQIPQAHFVVRHDKVVPNELSVRWIAPNKPIFIENATHNKIPTKEIAF